MATTNSAIPTATIGPGAPSGTSMPRTEPVSAGVASARTAAMAAQATISHHNDDVPWLASLAMSFIVAERSCGNGT